MSAESATDGMPSALPAGCRLCGAPLAGPYCHRCGQASVAAQRSFREVLMGQSGRLLHTLRLLLTRPGELACEIDEGRDRLSMRPLTLLLNLIPLFFLLGGGPGGFSARTLMSGDGSGTMVATIAHLAQDQGIAPALLEERIDQRFRAVYSLMVVVQMAAYGVVIGLLYRSRHKPWLLHFASAIHYMCFSFLLSTVLFGTLRALHVPFMAHPATLSITLAVNATYMGLMLHRIHGGTPLMTAGKTVLAMSTGAAVSLALTTAALFVAVRTA